MTTVTIPKELKGNDLIAIPRKEYKEFSNWRKYTKPFKTFIPTAAERKAFARGRENFAKGNYVTLEELDNELDRNSRRKR